MKPLSLALLASSLAASLGAQPQLVSPLTPPRTVVVRSDGTTPAQAIGIPLAEGDALRRAVDRVTRELNWFEDQDAAFALARRESKPVFWLQALGELDGYT